MLWILLKLQSASDVDLDVFYRNPLKYHYFIISWTNREELIAQNGDYHNWSDAPRVIQRIWYSIVCSSHHLLAVKVPRKFWIRSMEESELKVSLPYRDGIHQLPDNNENQAIRKIQQMKKRFQRDPFNSYTADKRT